MRNVVAAASIVLAANLLAACECGGFDGDGDRMLRRGDDMMMVCANGGFALTTSAGVVEGRFESEYVDAGSHLRMAGGETGMVAFTLDTTGGSTFSSAELGNDWSLATLDKYELDHAHVQCSDLETRAWWTTSTFAEGHYYQAADTQLLVCPSGAVKTRSGELQEAAYFGSVDAGHLVAIDATQTVLVSGEAREDGTFVGAYHGVTTTFHELPLADSHDLGQCD